MNAIAKVSKTAEQQIDELKALSADVLTLARQQGASACEVSLSFNHGLNVNVRMGDVESIERTQDRGLGLTVYFGHSKASASTADFSASGVQATVAQACAIAKHTEADSAAGLAEAALMATDFPELDLWHPWSVTPDQAIDIAQRCEAAGRGVKGISNSEGASLSTGRSLSVYANSHGFVGAERGTHHSISCSLIGGSGDSMQRDYWYTTALSADQLDSAESVGAKAADRTIKRLNPRKVKTGQFPVLMVPEMARSLIGHFLGAVSGGALYRRASFLLDSQGQRLFPEWISMLEQPHLKRGLRSAAFDGDGVATRENYVVQDGVLQHYLLSCYSARRLGLQTTANAGGVHNLQVASSGQNFTDLIGGLHKGVLITELMGQGVNAVTGDYSRGAAGFWVENGEIQYPIDEFTIAGNLREMLQRIQAIGQDIDPRSHIRCGSILLEKMTIAGD
jgi:PmbA protein